MDHGMPGAGSNVSRADEPEHTPASFPFVLNLTRSEADTRGRGRIRGVGRTLSGLLIDVLLESQDRTPDNHSEHRTDVLNRRKTIVTPGVTPGTIHVSMSISLHHGVPATVATLMSTLLLSMTVITSSVEAARIPLKDGQKIGFLGDSITQAGAEPQGYVTLVIRGLEANGIKAGSIPAGIGGHKSNQMLERLDRDVLSKKPDWMTLSCGVNDVWHGANGIPLEPYKKNITEIVEKCQAAGVKVMILTATMIGEDAPNSNNQKLAAYNDFLRDLAKKKKCRLADLNADMQAAIAKAKAESNYQGNLLTSDGVHMNPAGNRMMATGVLKAFGLNAKQLKKAQDSWSNPAPAKAH